MAAVSEFPEASDLCSDDSSQDCYLYIFFTSVVAQFEDKLKICNKVILKMRLQEERTILVQEMAQHCSWLQATFKRKTSEEGKFHLCERGVSY